MSREYSSEEVTCFIVNELDTKRSSVVTRTANKFGISSQAVRLRMRDLVSDGVLVARGSTRNRRYELRQNFVFRQRVPVKGLAEDIVFEKQVKPTLGQLPDNVLRICRYGFTEMVNNVIDHSASEECELTVSLTPAVVEFFVEDFGIGIFKKIKDALGLPDERQSLLELSKGKMTTDRARHSGEGIFFTSRVMDSFSITSGKLYFWHRINHDDWLIEAQEDYVQGTRIRMHMCLHSTTKLADVFNKFTTPEHADSFAKTHVPISLAQYGDGELVSRSQAKRVLARVEQFDEVLLDFENVDSVGQAFADEIFRVFRHLHPEVTVLAIRTNEQIESMISRAEAAYVEDVTREKQ